MKANSHIFASVSLGGILWFFTKSFSAGIICIAAGVLADFDHIIEYGIHYGLKNATYEKIVKACEQTSANSKEPGFKKLYLVFHAIEFAALLWIFYIYTRCIYILAAATGYTLHMMMDYMGNGTHILSYSILWRAANNFSVNGFLRKKRQRRE